MAQENLVYDRPEGFTATPTHYCRGCTHGVAHRLIAEVLEEIDALDRTIGIAPVGCAVFAYNYFDTDFVEAPHGRAPAMATGLKRVLPDRIVFTYQGDGDLASIGMGEIVHVSHQLGHDAGRFTEVRGTADGSRLSAGRLSSERSDQAGESLMLAPSAPLAMTWRL